MEKLVQFGAGSIGRSFIGQLFSRAGYEVVFVDVAPALVAALNERRSYRIEVRDEPPGEILVENVRAVNGLDAPAVVKELVSARVAGTAVGAGALRFLYPVLAAALHERRRLGMPPLDIILCENLHGAGAIVADGLRQALPVGFSLDESVGLVETSIGKMVPLAPAALRQSDPLALWAEAFNTLIVDGRAFKQAVPSVPGLLPKANMPAYVDRKLYIHNLGHAAVAYQAARLFPGIDTISHAVTQPAVRELATGAMQESAEALARAYPGEFGPGELDEHIQDLLRRFANPALGDTVFRVGRDVRRKLGRSDRVIGAMLMDLAQGVEPAYTAEVAAAAIHFRATGEDGQMDPADREFVTDDYPRGLEHVLQHISGLDLTLDSDAVIYRMILAAASG